MRHRSATHNFGRHPAHRRAMMRNIVMNLFTHGRIRTTKQKAKAAKPFAEKLITLGKKGTVHHRRLAIKELGSTVAAKAAVRVLFGELSERFSSRTGGYTRILHLPRTIRQAKVDLPRTKGVKRSKLYGTRLRDNADLVLFELCEAEINKPQRKARKVKSKKPKAKAKPKKAEPAESKKSEKEPEKKAAEPKAKKKTAAAPKAEKKAAEPKAEKKTAEKKPAAKKAEPKASEKKTDEKKKSK